MKILKRFLDEDEWHEVTELEALHVIAHCYTDPRLLLQELEKGYIVHTTFADFKSAETLARQAQEEAK